MDNYEVNGLLRLSVIEYNTVFYPAHLFGFALQGYFDNFLLKLI